ERDEEVRIDLHPALRVGVDLGDPAADALRVELGIPGLVQRVAEVNAPPVAAHLDHLRPTVDLSALRMLGARDDPAQAQRAGLLRMERIAHVILLELASAPTGDV